MISIIIPTYNEEDQLGKTLEAIYNNGNRSDITEVIVADGGSNDSTMVVASSFGAIAITCPAKGRAKQMNFGATKANGEVLYFLHADCIPPLGFTIDILTAVSIGYTSGCFRLAFDYNHWFLKANTWFTRFDLNYFRFGDQSLFVTKAIFNLVKGFDETMIVLEDQELVVRIKKQAQFIVMSKLVITSARKYLLNGVYKTQAVYFLIYLMYKSGVRQELLLSAYRKLIKQDKL